MIIPSTGRVKEITDMMESFGMYTQAEEIHLLAEERDRLDHIFKGQQRVIKNTKRSSDKRDAK
jgi:hypothetical protein